MVPGRKSLHHEGGPVADIYLSPLFYKGNKHFNMKTVTLNSQNPAFTVYGSEDMMSTEILKILFTEPLPSPPLNLEVLDENGILLYVRPLIPKVNQPDEVPVKMRPEVPINKRFIFSGRLTFQIRGLPGQNFALDLEYV